MWVQAHAHWEANGLPIIGETGPDVPAYLKVAPLLPHERFWSKSAADLAANLARTDDTDGPVFRKKAKVWDAATWLGCPSRWGMHYTQPQVRFTRCRCVGSDGGALVCVPPAAGVQCERLAACLKLRHCTTAMRALRNMQLRSALVREADPAGCLACR